MDEILFCYNNKIEIDTKEGRYKSTIQEIGEDYIGISIPILNGKYLPLPNGSEVDAFYYLGRDVYEFSTTVVGTKMDNKILIIVLNKPTSYEKVQRRNFARATTLTNVTYARKIGENYENFQGVMLDLSGGGARLHVYQKLRPGETILVYVPINDEIFNFKSQVIRIENQVDQECTVGLCFIDVEKAQREKLIKYVFNIMREQMQRSSKGE
ncbi:MAG: flagellar brake protein [Solirubrobacterales bacterium]